MPDISCYTWGLFTLVCCLNLFFELFLAHSLKSKSETLTTVCMLLEETNCCICHSEKSFLVADNRNKLLSFIDVVSEKSSKRYDISRSSLPCICRTALYAARSVVTFVSVDDNPAILHRKCTLAACLHTYTTLDTIVMAALHCHAALDSDIVFLSL